MSTDLKRRGLAALTGLALTATAVVAAPASTAQAATCHGVNEKKLVRADPFTGGETWEFKADSCNAEELVDAFGQVKDATSLAGLMSGKWPGALAGEAILFSWAWANQNKVKDCTKQGTGISFRSVNGIIMSCGAQ